MRTLSDKRRLSAALLVIAAATLSACESGKVSSGGEPVQPRDPRTARTARPVRSAATRAPAGTTAADGAAPELALKGGATVTLPPGAVARRKPGGLPDIVKSAHNYRLPGGKQRLMVSELTLEGKTCAQRLDAEWARMDASRKEQDPERLKLRRTTQVEQRTVAGHRVLYSESMQGTSLSDAGKPFAAIASAFMCEGENLLLIMYVSDQAELAQKIKPMLDGVIASYRPAGSKAR